MKSLALKAVAEKIDCRPFGRPGKVYKDGEYGFEIGKAVQLAEGTDLTIIACGSCAFQALEAAKILNSSDGIYKPFGKVINKS